MAPPRVERAGKESWVKKSGGSSSDKPAEDAHGQAGDDDSAARRDVKGDGKGDRDAKGKGRQPRDARPRRDPREEDVHADSSGALRGKGKGIEKGYSPNLFAGKGKSAKGKGKADFPSGEAVFDESENAHEDEELSGSALLNMLKANPPKARRYTKELLLSIARLPASNVKPWDLNPGIDKENKESHLLVRPSAGRGDGDDDEGPSESHPRQRRGGGRGRDDDEAAAAPHAAAASSPAMSPQAEPKHQTGFAAVSELNEAGEDDADLVKDSRAFDKWFDRKKPEPPAVGPSSAAIAAAAAAAASPSGSTSLTNLAASLAASASAGIAPPSPAGVQGIPGPREVLMHVEAMRQASMAHTQAQAQAMNQAQVMQAAAYMQAMSMQAQAQAASALRGGGGYPNPWAQYNPYMFPYGHPYGGYPGAVDYGAAQAMQAKLAAAQAMANPYVAAAAQRQLAAKAAAGAAQVSAKQAAGNARGSASGSAGGPAQSPQSKKSAKAKAAAASAASGAGAAPVPAPLASPVLLPVKAPDSPEARLPGAPTAPGPSGGPGAEEDQEGCSQS